MTPEGVPASAFGNRYFADLARCIDVGTPVFFRILDNTKGADFSHVVVVDGVATRNGISLVAIRDPCGSRYLVSSVPFKEFFR